MIDKGVAYQKINLPPSQPTRKIRSKINEESEFRKVSMELNTNLISVSYNYFQDTKTSKTTTDLKAPSLVQRRTTRNTSIVTTNQVQTRRMKNGADVGTERKEKKVRESEILSRGSGRWSFKQLNQKNSNNKNKEVNDGKNKENSQNSKFSFQRTWSHRRLSSGDSNIGLTKTSTLKAEELNGNDKKINSISSIKKSASQNDLNADTRRSISSVNAKMTPSVSTNSIPSEVSSRYF